MSRRRFLVVLTAALAALGTAAGEIRRILRELAVPEQAGGLPDAPPGPLDPAVLATLVASSRAVIGEPVETSHYAAYFQWRASHLRGYRAVYTEFHRAVDRDARRLAGRPFPACPPGVQRDVLSRLQARARSRWGRLLLGGLPWARYERYILQEALALFARTDAWVLLGYDGWPGVPQGLLRYQQAPRPVAPHR
jgi:hypothetical protein